MTGKWRELAQIRKKREQTASCSGVNMSLSDPWFLTFCGLVHISRLNLCVLCVFVCTYAHTSTTLGLWSGFYADQRFLLARVPLPVDSWGEKTSVQLVLVSPGRLKCNGWWDVQNPAKQRAETTAVMLASCVQITPYISTKAYVVYCTSVQQASFYYPTVLPPGKGTIINSAQSHAHLQQLILRQRAVLLT